jgi:EmrB/QacA subfamily drug resistance transporter
VTDVGEHDEAWVAAGLDPRRARRVLALTAVGFFITALDFTIVNVAFRPIRDDLGADTHLLSWTLSGYAIAFAAGLLTAGRMADAYGRKRAFLAGNVVFTLGSLVCGVAPSVEVLIAGRVVQALGGALLVPTATALVLPEYPVERRAHVFGITAAMSSIAAALGPVAGGVLTTQFGWRWVFLINLPIGLVSVVVGARLLRESRDPSASRRPDLLGAALAISSVGLLTLAIVEGDRWGWTSPTELIVLAVAIVLGYAFVERCRSSDDPVLDLSLLRLRFVSSANATNVLWAMGFYAAYFTNVGWLQEVWGYSAQTSGLLYLPGPIVATVASIMLGRHLRRLGPQRIVAAGTFLLAGLSLGFSALAGEERRYLALFLPLVTLTGLAVGSVIPALSGASNAYLPANRFAMGSALYTTGRQVGAALGLATVGALQARTVGIDGFFHSYWYVATVMIVAGVVMLTTYRRPSADDLAASAGMPTEATGQRTRWS